MDATILTAVLVLLAGVIAEGAAPSTLRSRVLLQASVPAPAPSPGEDGALFDWGRPCTLVGDPSEVEITGPDGTDCTSCGSGATATPDPTCTFKAVEVPVNTPINIFYHSSVHHLFLGDEACDFMTEICANDTSTAISAEAPCTYTFPTAGDFVISDKSGSGGSDEGGYCAEFGAHLNVTVTES